MSGDVIQWAATSTGIVAAIMVASNVNARIAGFGFVIFTASSLMWVSFGAIENDHGLLVQNAVLTVINIIGAWRYLFRKASPAAA
ncbi:MAG: hypothetical protein R3C54_08775 [Parvularculaceae bacterium]|nr:hypothetical protein [Caulobacterales bacterium]HRX40319.1 hypothetical protein [Parvularculaceae bacterium]